MTDNQTALDLARSTGKLLREVQRTADLSELGTASLKDHGDRRAQQHLAQRLAEMHPDDAVLSEEAADDFARLAANRVWIIDPLDGTREFAEGRPDWAVHVALWESGELTAGAVALPGIDAVLCADDLVKTWDMPSRLRLAVSRSRPTLLVERLARDLDADLVPMGSAGFKVGAVVRGEVDLYVHSGGQYEWDSAAPVVVARRAGLHTSRIDGVQLRYNQPNPYLPDLVVCNPLLSGEVLERLNSLMEGTTR